MKVIKRDGKIVEFNKDKIKEAVLAAFQDTDGEITTYAKNKASEISRYIEIMDKDLDIEEIQNIVESKLMASNRKDVARNYISYRNKKDVIRQTKTKLYKDITKGLLALDVQNQNANVDEYSFGGRIGAASDAVNKDYALNYCMSDMCKNNHLNNEIYIHDLNSYAIGQHNCLTIPFDKLLAKGFNTRQTDVRPANSINTAFQLVAVVFQLQSLMQFGGVSASHIDWTMIPYVRKSFVKHYINGLTYIDWDSNKYPNHCANEFYNIVNNDMSIDDDYFKEIDNVYHYAIDMTIKETQQAVEGMFHNLNTLQSRSGNQLPFTSINFGTCTLPEGRMVIKALLEGSIKGVGKMHKTSIFPCSIFQCMKGVNRNPGEPNYDMYQLALKSTAQRLYPNYANCDWSGNAGFDINDPRTYFSTMGCRTANGFDVNGFGQLKDGRGNIAPVTIIMPTIAMETIEEWNDLYGEHDINKDQTIEDLFLIKLDEKIYEAKEMLIERFNYICSQPVASAKFMYENGTMEGYIPEEGIISALKHGTLAIGNLGLAETLQIIIGTNHTTSKGMDLAKKIYQLFKDRCAEFKQEKYSYTDMKGNKHEYGLNFGVYNTPAENLCYTAMKKFKEKYGIIPNVSDKDFFTNSMHVPVWEKMTPFEKIDIESELTGYSSAGCITYIELESTVKNNLEALEQIVDYAMDKDIPYFAVNVPNDMCQECGYTDEINRFCPMCGSENIRRLRRVTGYLTGDYKTAFNPGKQQEVEMRIKHI